MSLVGPRPERPEFAKEFNKKIYGYMQRLNVTPGISGWAQIHMGYAGVDLDDHKRKLEYDLYYINNKSLRLDLKIIWKTVLIVIFPLLKKR